MGETGKERERGGEKRLEEGAREVRGMGAKRKDAYVIHG